MYRGQIDGLSGHARVVALDLPGFGDSPSVADASKTQTMDALATHVIAVADALGFDRFVLGGTSMGGYVAFAVLRKHRARVLGLALMDTRAEPDSPEGKKKRYDDAERVAHEGTGFMIEPQLGRLLSPRTVVERPDLKNAAELMMRRSAVDGVAATMRGLGERRDARAELAKIDVPTVVIVGSDDVITPPPVAKAMASAIPGAQLAIIPNAGHLAAFEQPTATNVALRTLLRKVGAKG
jgi:pimeloyl-ACP methyl ester carboxylesterase